MSAKIDFEAVKRIGIVMTGDILAAIVEILVYIPNFSNSEEVYSFTSFLVQAIRIICHLLVLVSLLRLKELNKSYRFALILYMVHLVLFAVSSAASGLMSAWIDFTDSEATVPYLILIAVFVAGSVVLAVGDRAVLGGTAQLLCSFGLIAEAAKNRRVGAMRIVTAAVTSFSIFALAVIVFIRMTSGVIDQTRVYSQLEKLPVLILVSLVVFGGILNIVSCFAAAGRMRRSYKEIMELTK